MYFDVVAPELRECFAHDCSKPFLLLHLREAFAKLGRDDVEVHTPVIPQSGNIVEQVLGALDRAAIVVADLTRNNPSVLYELAVRHCIGLPCIHVVDSKAKEDDELVKLAREALQMRLAGARDDVRLERALALLDDLARPLAFDVGHERYTAVDFESDAEGNQLLVKMLEAVIKDVEGSSAADRNPVTAYYNGTALIDVSPTAGIALGYFQNFVVRTGSSVIDSAKQIKIYGQEKANGQRAESLLEESKRTDVKLHVWIPDDIRFVNPDYIGKLKKTGKICDARLVQDSMGYRDINLLIHKDSLTLIDIPTTLRVIKDTIESRASSSRRVSNTVEAHTILKREFDRFRLALERWKNNFLADERNAEKPRDSLIRFVEERVAVEPLPREWLF